MTSVEYFEELAYLNCRSVSLRGAVKRMAVAVVHERVPEAKLTSAAECVSVETMSSASRRTETAMTWTSAPSDVRQNDSAVKWANPQ